jgi:hypothetical protein
MKYVLKHYNTDNCTYRAEYWLAVAKYGNNY